MSCFSGNSSWSSLYSTVESVGCKYLSFTRLVVEEDLLIICLTDGISLWQVDLNEEDIKRNKDAVGLDSEEHYLANIKEAFKKSDLQVSKFPQRLVLYFGSKPGSISLDLFEVTAQQRQEGLQALVFRLTDNMKSLEGMLHDANQKLKKVEDTPKIESPTTSPFKDVKKSKAVQRQRQVRGQSVINPGTKRKKAAQGVLFDE